MPVRVYRCCFCFSLRLGGIISALFYIIKITPFIALIATLPNSNSTISNLQKFFGHLNSNKEEPAFFLDDSNKKTACIILSGLLAWYVFTCILLAIGAFLTSAKLIYPYLITHLVGISVTILMYGLLFRYLMRMNSISSNVLQTELFGLGYIILYLSLAAFHIFFDIYIWICTYNLTKLLNELHSKMFLQKPHFEHPLFFENTTSMKRTPTVPVEGMTYKKSYY